MADGTHEEYEPLIDMGGDRERLMYGPDADIKTWPMYYRSLNKEVVVNLNDGTVGLRGKGVADFQDNPKATLINPTTPTNEATRTATGDKMKLANMAYFKAPDKYNIVYNKVGMDKALFQAHFGGRAEEVMNAVANCAYVCPLVVPPDTSRTYEEFRKKLGEAPYLSFPNVTYKPIEKTEEPDVSKLPLSRINAPNHNFWNDPIFYRESYYLAEGKANDYRGACLDYARRCFVRNRYEFDYRRRSMVDGTKRRIHRDRVGANAQIKNYSLDNKILINGFPVTEGVSKASVYIEIQPNISIIEQLRNLQETLIERFYRSNTITVPHHVFIFGVGGTSRKTVTKETLATNTKSDYPLTFDHDGQEVQRIDQSPELLASINRTYGRNINFNVNGWLKEPLLKYTKDVQQRDDRRPDHFLHARIGGSYWIPKGLAKPKPDSAFWASLPLVFLSGIALDYGYAHLSATRPALNKRPITIDTIVRFFGFTTPPKPAISFNRFNKINTERYENTYPETRYRSGTYVYQNSVGFHERSSDESFGNVYTFLNTDNHKFNPFKPTDKVGHIYDTTAIKDNRFLINPNSMIPNNDDGREIYQVITTPLSAIDILADSTTTIHHVIADFPKFWLPPIDVANLCLFRVVGANNRVHIEIVGEKVIDIRKLDVECKSLLSVALLGIEGHHNTVTLDLTRGKLKFVGDAIMAGRILGLVNRNTLNNNTLIIDTGEGRSILDVIDFSEAKDHTGATKALHPIVSNVYSGPADKYIPT